MAAWLYQAHIYKKAAGALFFHHLCWRTFEKYAMSVRSCKLFNA